MSRLFLCLTRATNATERCRIELKSFRVDRLVAVLAKTVIAAFDTSEGRLNITEHRMTTFACCLRHCLRLHRIHTRQRGGFDTSRSDSLEFFAKFEQPFPHFARIQ